MKWKINRLRIWHYFSTVVIVEWYKEYRVKKRKYLHVSLTWLANAIKTRCIPNAFWNKNDDVVVAVFFCSQKTWHFFHYMPPASGNHSIVLNKHTKPLNECVLKSQRVGYFNISRTIVWTRNGNWSIHLNEFHFPEEWKGPTFASQFLFAIIFELCLTVSVTLLIHLTWIINKNIQSFFDEFFFAIRLHLDLEEKYS